MKLGTKLVFYNSITKIIIIALLGATLPEVVEQVVFKFIDSRLSAKKEKVMNLIKKGGISEIELEEDCTYANYTLLKQEYVYVEPLAKYENIYKIENTVRIIEKEDYRFRTLSYSFIYNNQYYLLEIGEGLGTIERIKFTLQLFLIGMLAVLLVITIIVDISFTRYILRPFNQIIFKKLRIAGHPSTFNTTPIKSSTQDFNYLDQSINELMERIKHAFLIEKEFIANASHELLTPISVLQGKLENIVAREDLPHDVAVKIVEAQGLLIRLTKIVRALLMISKIENEQYLKTDKVELNELLREVIHDIEDRAIQKNIVIKDLLNGNFIVEQCNRSLLYTLFFNIINNAIRYNKADGEIIISSASHSEGWCISIVDTGIGIPSDKFSVIFDRFKKNSMNSPEHESYGLGLSIVKTIAEFHHVKILVESEIGVGSKFLVIFKK